MTRTFKVLDGLFEDIFIAQPITQSLVERLAPDTGRYMLLDPLVKRVPSPTRHRSATCGLIRHPALGADDLQRGRRDHEKLGQALIEIYLSFCRGIQLRHRTTWLAERTGTHASDRETARAFR